ncbi:MAG: 23S rRNA (cytidine(2498)-2'-O)-methyltransferase RlmM [Marinobacter sp.]|uniref:23S rRNA (cytidine(2498)-2'-O)-methyltransferase RlmM n=1 Tax=Marinobacter sp. TaxID=50741 RepID=UPI00299DE437|nr:23S rRNA (cytidine(2498)-2'-O)-methyltransferase RlmM [Marinobacter sp.]MDX1754778.1 23S rRNA (cytidine(2498)-2'-O)-methyltransferase RlmM [Marinobacter sp.]
MAEVLLFCRPGFEVEAGREVTDIAAVAGVFGYFQAGPCAGLVTFHLPGPETPVQLMEWVHLDQLVFIRDWCISLGSMSLPPSDRVGAVIEFLRAQEQPLPPCARVEVRLPESNTDSDLGNFARKWVAPLARGLRGAGLLMDAAESESAYRLEMVLHDFGSLSIGVSRADNRARYLGGIPRLRLPAAAPSRSALKLEEAWKVFLPADEELAYLGGGKKAVDLGAAPGGWTWQLVRQGMTVAAVDNGPMNDELMKSGLVQHVQADGYQWRPKRAVDWMVCDIVDKPRKTARLAAEWVADRLCRYTVFNLKLPMKQRYDEWLLCRQVIGDVLGRAEVGYRLRARQLYHDREEITCFIERLD